MRSVRNLLVDVSPEGISPSEPLAAGVQGDHNVTLITFRLEESLVRSEYRFRLEYEDGSGFCDSTDFMEPDGTELRCFLPLSWTQSGGVGLLRLVISVPGQDGDEQTMYSEAVRLRFSPRRDGEAMTEEMRPMLSSLLENSDAILKKAATMATRAEGDDCARHMAILDETGNLADSGILCDKLVTTDDMAEYTPRASGFNDEGERVYGLVSTAGPKEFLGVCIEDGNLRLYPATEAQIAAQFEAGATEDCGFDTPITPRMVNWAVKTALTKNYLTWSEAEKAAARELIGVDDSAPAPSFKPYTSTGEILADAALIGNGELYVLWVGADKTMFDYGTAITVLGTCELVRFTVVNGAITGMNRVGKTTVTVDPSLDGDSTNPVQNKAICQTLNDYSVRISGLQENVGDVAAALDEILTMQEVLISGGIYITNQLVDGLYFNGETTPTETGYHKSVVLNLSPGEYTLKFNRGMRIQTAYINGVWFDSGNLGDVENITEFTFEVTEENTQTYFSFGVSDGNVGLLDWTDDLIVTIALIGGGV